MRIKLITRCGCSKMDEVAEPLERRIIRVPLEQSILPIGKETLGERVPHREFAFSGFDGSVAVYREIE
jgi:hypothetical protein